MEGNSNFQHILERFKAADVDTKIEMYTTIGINSRTV